MSVNNAKQDRSGTAPEPLRNRSETAPLLRNETLIRFFKSLSLIGGKPLDFFKTPLQEHDV